MVMMVVMPMAMPPGQVHAGKCILRQRARPHQGVFNEVEFAGHVFLLALGLNKNEPIN